MITEKIKASQVKRGDVLWEPPFLQKVTWTKNLKSKKIKVFYRCGECSESIKSFKYDKVILLDDTTMV